MQVAGKVETVILRDPSGQGLYVNFKLSKGNGVEEFSGRLPVPDQVRIPVGEEVACRFGVGGNDVVNWQDFRFPVILKSFPVLKVQGICRFQSGIVVLFCLVSLFSCVAMDCC